MEVMVVVICISKISTRIVGRIRGRRDNAIPGTFVYEGKLLYIGSEESERGFEIGEACLSERRILKEVVKSINDAGKFCESLHDRLEKFLKESDKSLEVCERLRFKYLKIFEQLE